MRTGIDIIEVERIKTNDLFLSKIANDEEIAYIRTYKTEQNQKETIAGLWAVKKLFSKLWDLGRTARLHSKTLSFVTKKAEDRM